MVDILQFPSGRGGDDAVRCKDCVFSFFPEGFEKPGQCRFNPPTALAIPQQDRLTGSMSMNLISTFPPVAADVFCYSGDDELHLSEGGENGDEKPH